MGNSFVIGHCPRLASVFEWAVGAIEKDYADETDDVTQECLPQGCDIAEIREVLLNALISGDTHNDSLIDYFMQTLFESVDDEVLLEMIIAKQIDYLTINERGYYMAELNSEL